MKVDPKTGARYAHTPEEWSEVLRTHGAGMSLPPSVATNLGPAFKESTVLHQSAGADSGSKKDG